MDSDNSRQQQQQRKPSVVGDLPQWNSKFSFSAQKHHHNQAAAHDQQQQPRTTPRALGQARRVPVPGGAGAGAGVVDRHHRPDARASTGGHANNMTTPQGAERTPTLCLFERFERLTLGGATPASTAPAAAAAAPAGSAAAGRSCDSSILSAAATTAAAPQALGGGAGAGTSSSTDSEQCVARARPARRSVAFGTPSVLAYSPAGPAEAGGGDDDGDQDAGGEADSTPLWSNAGHTPYSLPGSSGYSSGSRIQEALDQKCCEEDNESSDTPSAAPLITAAHGVQRASTASSMQHGRGGGRHSGLRMELFTSVIHEVTQEESEVTPVAAAALRCPRTPVEEEEEGQGAVNAASSDVAAGGGAGDAGSELGAEGSAASAESDDMDCLQTPATVRIRPGQHHSTTPAAAAAAGSFKVASAAAAPAESGGGSSSFTGFTAGASAAGEEECTASTPMPQMRLPAATPKSKLRQPERVTVQKEAHHRMPVELSKLLGDADAAAAASAALHGGSSVSQAGGILGSCEVLSPVRARRQVQHALGASEQVLTPVRRSARKGTNNKGSRLLPGVATACSSASTTTPAAVRPMLEATNYCYQPNEALQK